MSQEGPGPEDTTLESLPSVNDCEKDGSFLVQDANRPGATGNLGNRQTVGA